MMKKCLSKYTVTIQFGYLLNCFLRTVATVSLILAIFINVVHQCEGHTEV